MVKGENSYICDAKQKCLVRQAERLVDSNEHKQ